MTAALVLLLLPEVAASGGEGVPDAWVERARVFLAEALAGAGAGDDARVALVLHRDEEALARATAPSEGRPPDRPGALYDPASRTVHAWCVPRAAPVLFRDGLPGLLQGALAHEAQHAAAHAREGRMRIVPFAAVEGAADEAAVRWLAGRRDPAARAWEWMLASRVVRSREEGLFADEETFAAQVPAHLDASRRAVWYAQAWLTVRDEPPPAPDWLLWDGLGEPRADGFRLVAPAGGRTLLLQREPGPLVLELAPLPFGAPGIEVSAGDAVVRIDAGGTARVVRDGVPVGKPWTIAFPVRVERVDGVLRVGVVVVGEAPGRAGVGVVDGGVDVAVRGAS